MAGEEGAVRPCAFPLSCWRSGAEPLNTVALPRLGSPHPLPRTAKPERARSPDAPSGDRRFCFAAPSTEKWGRTRRRGRREEALGKIPLDPPPLSLGCAGVGALPAAPETSSRQHSPLHPVSVPAHSPGRSAAVPAASWEEVSASRPSARRATRRLPRPLVQTQISRGAGAAGGPQSPAPQVSAVPRSAGALRLPVGRTL